MIDRAWPRYTEHGSVARPEAEVVSKREIDAFFPASSTSAAAAGNQLRSDRQGTDPARPAASGEFGGVMGAARHRCRDKRRKGETKVLSGPFSLQQHAALPGSALVSTAAGFDFFCDQFPDAVCVGVE